MFDYQGYSTELLDRLCQPEYVFRGLCRWGYWVTEAYSFGRCLRLAAGGFPDWLPLYVYGVHGAAYGDCTHPHELNNDAGAMLVHNREAVLEYQAKSDKPCYLVTMPYVTYRRQMNIEPVSGARGTLSFPSHSTVDYKSVFDVEKYISDLKALPSEFQPVCVCLHMADIHRGLHRQFLKHGLPVYTAGHTEDLDFVVRLYYLLKHFKYTTSNHVGSYTYYSIEMGLPFSLYGEDGYLLNENDSLLAPGEIIKFDTSNFYGVDWSVYYKRQVAFFAGLKTEISPEQKQYVENGLGVGQGLSPKELNQVLWNCLKQRHPLKDIRRGLRNRLKYFFFRKPDRIEIS